MTYFPIDSEACEIIKTIVLDGSNVFYTYY
jgi:hypothetical protein